MQSKQPAAPTTSRPWLRLGSIARLGGRGQARGPTPAPASGPVPVHPQPALVPTPQITAVLPPAAPLQPQPQPNALPAVPPQIRPLTPPTSTNGAQMVEAQKGPDPVPPPSPMIQVLSKGPSQPNSPKVTKPSTPTTPEYTLIRQVEAVKTPPSPHPEPEQNKQGNNNGVAKTIVGNNSKPLTNDSQLHFDKRAPPPPSPIRKAASSGSTKKKDDDGGMKMITMAGENTGAYMELGSQYRQTNHQKQPHFLRTDSNELKSEDGKTGDKEEKGKVAAQGNPIEAFVNSNVQSVNNSILLGSYCNHQNPGVHITFSTQRKPKHKGLSK